MDDIGLRMTIIAMILFAGVALNRFSKWLKMPLLICFLAIGCIGGRHGLNIFVPWDMKTVQICGEIALCFIMFSGGLQTSFKAVKSVFVTGTILATAGVLLTALAAGGCIYYLSNRMSMFYSASFAESLMTSAIFASTDAAAVFAILRGQKAAINPKLQSLLEYESGSNDPAAFLLTSVMIGIVNSGSNISIFGVTWTVTEGIVWGLGAGAFVGFLIGIFGQIFYNWMETFLEYNGLRLVAAIAIVLLCYGIANTAFHTNALMACYVAGITMGNMRFNFKQVFIKFHDGISWLMQLCLFTMLGSFFDYHMLFNVRNVVGAILCSVILMFIARPLVVMLCMIRSPFTLKERLFTSWVGIRGSAPIMLAAMVLASIPQSSGLPTTNLFYIIFTIVLISILLQGSTIMWAAKKLGLMLPYEEKEEPLLEYDERSDGREMNQFTISKGNILIGKKLGEIELESGPILLMIKRKERFIQTTENVILQEGDILSFLGEREAMRTLHSIYFPDEEYTSPLTVRQLWNGISKKYIVPIRKKIRKK